MYNCTKPSIQTYTYATILRRTACECDHIAPRVMIIQPYCDDMHAYIELARYLSACSHIRYTRYTYVCCSPPSPPPTTACSVMHPITTCCAIAQHALRYSAARPWYNMVMSRYICVRICARQFDARISICICQIGQCASSPAPGVECSV